MPITAAIAADLKSLTATLFDPTGDTTTDIEQTILGFVDTARLAVSSFVGLTITITTRTGTGTGTGTSAEHVLLRVTLLEPDDPGRVATSLLLPGPPEATSDQPRVQIVLYATTPGAFVDMAADLAFLTGNPTVDTDLDHHQHLARQPDITGPIHNESVINEAVGVLIADGHTLEQAHTYLDALAGAAHTNKATEASALLAALTPGGPPAAA